MAMQIKICVMSALFSLVALQAVADAPRTAVPRQKTISSAGELRQIGANSYLFTVEYTASVTIQLVEHGHCGAFSCDLSCTIHATAPSLQRTVYVSPQGSPPSPRKSIGFRVWTRGGDKLDYEANCNNTENTHMATFVDQNLSGWDDNIANDSPEVENIKAGYAPTDARYMQGLLNMEKVLR